MSQPNNVSAAGDDDLAQMTPNQKRALSKALSALETMAALWGSEIRLTDMAKRIADVPDAAERAKRIAAFVEQGFIEGAYRHYLDHKDQIEARAAASAQAMEQAVPEVSKIVPIKLTPSMAEAYRAYWSSTQNIYGAWAAMLAAAPSPAAREAGDGVTWQPIETAPKDGTPLLLFARSIHATASIPMFGWFLEEHGWIAHSFHGIDKIIPSHWMPRPEFPGTLSQKKSGE